MTGDGLGQSGVCNPTLNETDCEIHVQVFLSVHGTDGLTSPPKDGILS